MCFNSSIGDLRFLLLASRNHMWVVNPLYHLLYLPLLKAQGRQEKLQQRVTYILLCT